MRLIKSYQYVCHFIRKKLISEQIGKVFLQNTFTEIMYAKKPIYETLLIEISRQFGHT